MQLLENYGLDYSTDNLDKFSTLVDLLHYRGQYQPNKQAYIFLQDGETESGTLTYGELDRQARAIAAQLQSWQGERALLLYPSGLEFITAFFGCLYAGVVAVPVYPPRRNQKLSRLLSIADDAQAKLALTTTSILTDIDRRWEQEPELLADLKWVATDTIEANDQEFMPRAVTSESLAFLQYTSGSTGTPKGVMVTHGNIIHNQQLIQQAFGHSEQTIFVGWLPLFHDMGLIGNVLQPMYLGIPCILMPPVAFLTKPIRWLKAISKYRATTSGGPNFAYDLCVKKVPPEELANLDLSSWDLAFNGAEPIRAETLKQFANKFAPCGFNYSAFYPCYGMAETTLLAAGGVKNLKPVIRGVKAAALEQNSVVETELSWSGSRALVGSGRPYRFGKKVALVNPESFTRCKKGEVGEIWVSGESVASGYWNRPEATQETFQAYVADTGEGPFLRTGDLGFKLNGELFVTGRVKDVIIIRGRNCYPQDIELTVENSHPALRSHCSAAFSQEIEGEERLLVACEVERTYLRKLNTEEIVKEIQIAVSTEHELEVHGVVLLKTASIPKTSSGKIQRRACKQGFLEDSLNVVGQWQKTIDKNSVEYVAPRTPGEEQLANIFAEVLGVEKVGIYDNFFELGGHSLLATQLISRLREAFDLEIPLRTVFESPTVAQLEPTLTQLRTTNSGLRLPPIQPRTEGEQLPLSWAQERLWFLNQLEGASATYNMPAAFRINGNLDINALQQALSEIVRRHEVLRTSFPTVDGIPIQVIDPQATLNIKVLDLQQLKVTERETVLQQQVQQEAITPFDLESAPLIRCSLWQLEATEYVLLLNMHHIVSDGWSMGVLIQELSSLYQAFTQGEPSPLPELPIQYADFALWQKQWLSGEVLETQLNYWQEQLHGAPELLQLPTDRSRPTVQTYQGATQTFSLNTDLTQKLQTLSRESGTTLFMTLLAAFATLLYRYSGQSDILIGSPIANRNRSEIESLIGFFVNTLVLRTSFEDNPRFESLLAQVRETTLKAYEHQDVPFEQVVEALQPERSLSHSPLFQVMFVLQNAPMGELELPGVTLSELHPESTIAKFALTLSMTETDQGLVGEWEYNTDLFDGSTIERMAGHFQNLLSGIVENPQVSVGELPLLSETERHQLLVEWNDTASVYPQDKCIHQLFESQVEKTPDAVAIVFEKEQLTYQQLNQRANQLAHHLQSLGVGPEVLVGICVERSLEMVVGLLGILKAGGAYVPLDPNYPQERLSYMLADSSVEVLLTQSSLLESLPEQQAQVVCLDSDWGAIEQKSQENIELELGSDNLAYVIYTSGSTGKPKGVLVEHQGLCNLAQAQRNLFDVEPTSRVLQFASVSFDASVWEIFMAVTSGAMLVLGTASELMPGDDLKQILELFSVTHVTLPPSALAVLPTDELPALGQIIVAGEACPAELVHQWSVGRRFFNAYGPTESTVCATVAQISDDSEKITIGRPIANTQIYILDEKLQPVPIGVTGELYIGGDGLARGYLNRPELTGEKFIQNPFSNYQSEHLYKTGDLARYLPDGNIEFLGRIDNQVKIRGFRIELGEIEAVLNTHPQIQQAVVIAREDIPSNKRLVAYVVSEDESLTTNQLREFLKQKLPEYMVPSAFVTLDALPLTPNGKIDRKALPEPDGEITREQEYVAPRTEIEQTLTDIWQELLLKEKVSIHDNFFEIGGDSILSIQVVSRAKNSGIQITPQQIFQNQSIAELARVANTTVSVSAQQGIVTGVAPLTPIQYWFLGQNPSEAHHFNQSVLLQIPNDIKPELLRKAVEKLLEHHDALRLRFPSQASEYKQINQGLDNTVPFTVVDLSSTPVLSQPQTLEQIATEYQASLNLSTGPIMRVVMFNLGSEVDARLLIIIHHLAVDGVSWRILLSDLETIYQQLIHQKPIQLSAKTTAFIDWAEKLNSYAQSERIKPELGYWLNQPWSLTTPLPLDYAYTQPENTIGNAASVSVKLSVEDTRALLGSVNEAYNTQINDLLLSALLLSLAQWTENSKVLIDLEGHGREELFEDVDLSRTVGWFTSLFPVLLQLPEFEQPAAVIKSIKEQLRAIPHRGIGYGILRYLCEDTTVSQQLQTIPTPEISFNYLGQFDQVESQTGWKFASESTGANHSSKQTRNHLLDINALVVQGELKINWTYSNKVHTHATVENLAQSYLKAIRLIIEHCQLEDACGYTPSDLLELPEDISELLPDDTESAYPLAKMQEFILHHYSNDHQKMGVYHCQQSFDIYDDNLSLNAFKMALEILVQKHPAFRTVFITKNGKPVCQVVKKNLKYSINEKDISNMTSNAQKNYIDEFLKQDRQNLFNVENPNESLFRFRIFQKAKNRFEFLISIHHAIADGWGNIEFLKELYELYSVLKTGEEITVAPLANVYKEFVALEKEIIGSKEASNFWRLHLKNHIYKPLKPLKTPIEKVEAVAEKCKLDSELIADLGKLCRQLKVSPKAIFLSTYLDLIGNQMKENMASVGIVSNGRTERLSDPFKALGLFWNIVPFCQPIISNKIEQIKNVQQTLVDMEPYVRYPLLQILSDQEKKELFFATFNFLHFHNAKNNFANTGLSLALKRSHDKFNFPLNYVVSMNSLEGNVNLRVEYDRLYFSSEEIRSMMKNYVDILKHRIQVK